MAEIVITVDVNGGQETAPSLPPCRRTTNWKHRKISKPVNPIKTNKVDDILVKNIRNEALAVRYYEQSGMPEEADNAKKGIITMAMALAGVEIEGDNVEH